MNNRIQNFADQAKDLVPKGILAPDLWIQEYNRIFAKMIIEECIYKIETYTIPIGNSAAGEMACEWTYAALKEVRDDIREHFGVES